MSVLSSCPSCSGFVPPGLGRCPNCGAQASGGGLLRRLKILGVTGLLGGSAVALTLMACYGLPPCEPGDPGCYPPLPDLKVTPADGGCAADAGGDLGPDGGCAR